MPVFTRRAPTGDEGDVSDIAIQNIREWIEKDLGWTVARERLVHVLQAVADRNRFDPVVQYLEGLEWDRQPRLDGWLVRNAGAPDSDYVRAVSAAWMISCVARALRPGCKVDHVLVLEGEQGARKSTAFAVLAGDAFFSDSCPQLGTKDARQHIHSGPWIVELGELTAIRRADIETVKQFLVEKNDRFRWSYARFEVDLPRRSVFCGTTNPSGAGWIRDPTGGRRFWPVPVGQICIEELACERDQLWAEAVHRFREGEPWWLRGELEESAQAEQEERLEHDEWEDIIGEWLGDREEVSIGDVLEMLGTRQRGLFEDRPSPSSWTPADQQRVARALRRLGWVRHKPKSGRRVWMRRSPPASPQDSGRNRP